MIKRIIVDCLICSALVAGGKIFSNVAEKNPKLKVVKTISEKQEKIFLKIAKKLENQF